MKKLKFYSMKRTELPSVLQQDFLQLPDISQKTRECFSCLVFASQFAQKQNKTLLAQGGFAVDLAVGKITRNHDDLDVITLENEIPFLRQFFKNHDFLIHCLPVNDPLKAFTFEKGIVHGDMDSVLIEGETVSDKGHKDEERWVWPIKASELIWSRNIGDVSILFLSPVVVYDFKKRQQQHDTKRDKENWDFQILENHFPFLKK
jgi:hypothetical protein